MIIGIGSTVLAWPQIQSAAAKSGSTSVLTAITLTVLLFGGLSVALWYGIARRASNVARWIYVVWMSLSSVSTLYSLADARGIQGSALAVSLVSTALTIASIFCLFKADAVFWLKAKAPVNPAIFE